MIIMHPSQHLGIKHWTTIMPVKVRINERSEMEISTSRPRVFVQPFQLVLLDGDFQEGAGLRASFHADQPVGDVQVWRYGGGCRCSDVEAWRSGGALQAWRYGRIEVWGRAVGVATWRYGGMEL